MGVTWVGLIARSISVLCAFWASGGEACAISRLQPRRAFNLCAESFFGQFMCKAPFEQ